MIDKIRIRDRRTETDRRDPTDRRAGHDRRRNADLRTPILQIGPSLLRLAIYVERTNGASPLLITRTVPWRDQADSLHSPLGFAELQKALTLLVVEERLAGTSAIVLLGSDYCVTRVVAGNSDQVEREIQQIRERSQHYLALGSGPKVVASSSSQLDARHTHALLTITTQQTLKGIVEAVDEAGLQLQRVESSQVALAHLLSVAHSTPEPLISIHLESERVALGIACQGRLFLDYRPGGRLTSSQLTDVLSEHHSRLQRYCQRQHGIEQRQLTQVVVGGEEQEVGRALERLASHPTLTAQPLDLESVTFPWEFRDGIPGSEFASLLGVALRLAQPGAAQSPNLLSSLKAEVKLPLARMFATRLAPVAATLLVALGLLGLNWGLSRQISAMQNELARLAPQVASADQTRRELFATTVELKQLGIIESHLPPQPVAAILRNITQSMPPEVWLTGLRLESGSTASLAGASYAEAGIYDFVSHLPHIPGVADAALHGTGAAGRGDLRATSFDIRMHLDLHGSIPSHKDTP